jgi:hypothetical protein
MIQPEAPEEKKKGFTGSLPKIGRLSQLILLIGVFLIIFVPLWLLNQKQSERQAELRTTLANLTRVLAVEEAPEAKLEAELAQATAETEATKALFPATNQSPEILDSLIELAELNDLCITATSVELHEADSEEDKAKVIGPMLRIVIGLRGQVPKFQNFLLALDDLLPTSQINTIAFATDVG